MPPTKLDTEVALLKRDILTNTDFGKKLESSIEKISEVLGTLTKIVAVHEEKHDKQDRVMGELALTSESRRIENNNSYKDLTQKIDDLGSELKQELSKDIQESEDRILEKWDKQQEDFKDAAKVKDADEKVFKKGIEDRLSSLEKWRWIMVGVAAAIGFLAGKIPFSEIQHLLVGGLF